MTYRRTRAHSRSVNPLTPPPFALDTLLNGGQTDLAQRFAGASHLFVEAARRGSKAARRRLFKQHLQDQLAHGLRLTVTLCHAAPGTSPWNPIQLRRFSEISNAWAGGPLRSF